MLSDGLALGILTLTAAILLYKKLPRRVRKFLEKHALLTEILAAILTYWLHGGTLTALVASGFVGIMVSALIYIAQNPDDFMYLEDFAAAMKQGLESLQATLREYGKQYREAKGLIHEVEA
jgi:hypothetical protein